MPDDHITKQCNAPHAPIGKCVILTPLTTADILKSLPYFPGVFLSFWARHTAESEVMIVHMISGHPYVYL